MCKSFWQVWLEIYLVASELLCRETSATESITVLKENVANNLRWNCLWLFQIRVFYSFIVLSETEYLHVILQQVRQESKNSFYETYIFFQYVSIFLTLHQASLSLSFGYEMTNPSIYFVDTSSKMSQLIFIS